MLFENIDSFPIIGDVDGWVIVILKIINIVIHKIY